MPRFLVCDGQSVYRIGLRSLIKAEMPSAEVIEASNPERSIGPNSRQRVRFGARWHRSVRLRAVRFLEGGERNLAGYALYHRIHIRHSGRYSRDPGSRISRLHFKTPVRHRDSRRRYGAYWLGGFTCRRRSPRWATVMPFAANSTEKRCPRSRLKLMSSS